MRSVRHADCGSGDSPDFTWQGTGGDFERATTSQQRAIPECKLHLSSMNLAGSFWVNAFGTHLGNQASPIDAILERSDFTLQELLAQDDIIQECKALNGALIE